uniref:Uncharacterized protein n=1 Tax=Phlebotomus papatasi TaxID=29031 RepID=A0A1B0CYZ6_PHLPP
MGKETTLTKLKDAKLAASEDPTADDGPEGHGPPNPLSGDEMFRPSRPSTAIGLESEIQEAFARKEHLVAVFFDLKKAYDMTWPRGVIESVLNHGITGNMAYFINNFLQNRKIRVIMGNYTSNTFQLDNSVPQGSVLSVTLFLVYINEIFKYLPSNVQGLLYADDLVIFHRSHNIDTCEENLQLAINSLQEWSNKSGLQFSHEKSRIVHFCKLRKPHNDPKLTLNGNNLPLDNEHKFLGLIFDKKLTWKSHILQLKTKCQKSMNIIRSISHKDWGGNRKNLLKIFNSLILTIEKATESDTDITLCWVPSHLGVAGNEEADRLAGRHQEIPNELYPPTTKDLLLKAEFTVKQEWETQWSRTRGDKLGEIKTTMEAWDTSYRSSRREEVWLCRLRIGHSYLTHSYILEREESPICEHCNNDLSIKHLLLECPNYAELRRKHGIEGNIKEMLKNEESKIKKVILFIKESKIYEKL